MKPVVVVVFVVVVVVVVALAACAEPHVALHGPTATTTPAERVAMFHALERAGQDTIQISRNNGPYQLAGARLVLGDGTRVELPEDLLPVVPPDSDTARAARASSAVGHRANTWMYIGFGALAASVITVVAVETERVSIGAPDGYLFAGAALVTGLPFFAARQQRQEELQLRMQAFTTYTRDLGIKLDVCAHGLEVVPCEAPQPIQPPGLAPSLQTPTAVPPQATQRPAAEPQATPVPAVPPQAQPESAAQPQTTPAGPAAGAARIRGPAACTAGIRGRAAGGASDAAMKSRARA